MSNFEQFFTFPFSTPQARKNFLIGCLVVLAGMFIPILPIILYYGYIAKIMREIIHEDKAPGMPDWGNLTDLLPNGLRLYGAHLVFALPAVLIYLIGFFAIFFGILIGGENIRTETLMTLGIGLGLVFTLFTPLILIGLLIAYPAGVHVVAKEQFSAAFQFREWWKIVRQNISGFLLSLAAAVIIGFAYSILYQILFFTIILICLTVPLVLAYSFYVSLVSLTLAAKAYHDGQAKLTATPSPEA